MRIMPGYRKSHSRLMIILIIAVGFIFGMNDNSIAIAQPSPEAVESACFELWQATINVAETGGANKDLVYGQGIYATNDKDPCDQLAPPPPVAGAFDARLTVSSPANDFFTEYKASTLPGVKTEWRISFQPSTGGGYPFTFSWDIASLPAGGSIRLQDVTASGVIDIDMRSQSSFVLSDTDYDRLDIAFTPDRCPLTAIASGNWNNPDTWDNNCTFDTPDDTTNVDVIIPNGHVVTFNLTSDTVETLTVGGGGGTLQFPGAGTLNVNGDVGVRDGLLDLGSQGILNLGGSLENEGRMRQTKAVNETESTEATVTFLDLAGYGGLAITTNGTSLGSTTVTIKGAQACDTDDTAVQRCFTIDPTSSTTAAGLTFYYLDAEINKSICSTMQAWRSTGTNTWTEAGTVGTRSCGSDPHSVAYSSVTIDASGSIFDLRSTEAPTAVTLNSFGAYSNNLLWLLPIGLLVSLISLGALTIWKRQSIQNKV